MNYRGRSPLMLGIALAAMMAVGPGDEEQRRHAREARDPPPESTPTRARPMRDVEAAQDKRARKAARQLRERAA